MNPSEIQKDQLKVRVHRKNSTFFIIKRLSLPLIPSWLCAFEPSAIIAEVLLFGGQLLGLFVELFSEDGGLWLSTASLERITWEFKLKSVLLLFVLLLLLLDWFDGPDFSLILFELFCWWVRTVRWSCPFNSAISWCCGRKAMESLLNLKRFKIGSK